MKNEQSQIVLIFGRKGSGKTTLLRKAIRKIRGKKTILIIDLINKFSDFPYKNFKDSISLTAYSSPNLILICWILGFDQQINDFLLSIAEFLLP